LFFVCFIINSVQKLLDTHLYKLHVTVEFVPHGLSPYSDFVLFLMHFL